MKKLLIIGVGLAIALSSGMALADSDQATGTFQTLGSVAAEDTALTAMTGEQLNAVEGKYRLRDGGYLFPYFGGARTNHNHSNVNQSNGCTFCGNANGGLNGGGANLGVIQTNQNGTGQSIGGFPIAVF